MARQIDPEETFDDLHDEVDYTEARLLDEVDAQALAPRIEPWRAQVETTEKAARALRRDETRTQAAIDGANLALDGVSDDFAGSLSLAVGGDRTSARFRAHFRESPSAFKRAPLKEQTTAVRGWLTDSKDPILEEHRSRLEGPTARSEAALGRGTGLSTRRGNLWTEREALAAYLTKERDALEDELAGIARAKGHDRHWARSFFRTRRVRPPKKDGNDGGGGTT